MRKKIGKIRSATVPRDPMPMMDYYCGFDVVAAKVSCGGGRDEKGIKPGTCHCAPEQRRLKQKMLPYANIVQVFKSYMMDTSTYRYILADCKQSDGFLNGISISPWAVSHIFCVSKVGVKDTRVSQDARAEGGGSHLSAIQVMFRWMKRKKQKGRRL